MIELDPRRLAELAAWLEERIGLHVRPEALGTLRFAVAARFEGGEPPRAGPDGYVDLLRSSGGDEELSRLLPLVTVTKTSFFRDEKQFRALAALLPGLLERGRSAERPVAIWSAGCATGEEAWSIAITAAEAGARAGDVELVATDVNPQAAADAARGAFDARRLRDLPPDLVERYFERQGELHRARDGLRALLASARAHNLVSAVYPRPTSGAWDVIFCRNVLIYFDRPTARAVLARFLGALAPGGWLFLGSSESLFRMFDGFELAEVAGAFVYRRPDAPEKLERARNCVLPPPEE